MNPDLKERLICCGIEELEISDHSALRQTFDLIVMQDVLEHLFDPINAIELLLGRLNKNGLILLEFHRENLSPLSI